MRIISRADSRSAALLRTLADASEVLRASNFVLSWGVPVPGVFGGMPGLDGLQQLQAFRAADVSCPLFVTERPCPPEASEWWGRKRHHTQGRDICMLPARPRGWKRSEFWVYPVTAEREFRVHIFSGKSIARAEKVPAAALNAAEPPPTCPLRRSRRFGWRLRHGCEMPQAVREAARAAVAACGYDFGAVDVLWTGATPVVLEVNRAPGLDNATASAYIAALERKVSAV